MTRGIVLSGGTGSRLFPMTHVVSKQLMPVYDKPMIYYPLATLMQAGIRDILIITTPSDVEDFKRLLGTGDQWGIRLEYATQDKPSGIAESFIIGEEFIGKDSVCLILGDNLFYGDSAFYEKLKEISYRSYQGYGATIFGHRVDNPQDYGVVEFDQYGSVVSLEEKPKNPKSNYAIPGIYFYDDNVVKYAKQLIPSPRGELEITDLNKMYLDDYNLKVSVLERGTTWLDTGTPDSLMDAAHFVQVIQKRQGLKIACLEEIAFRRMYIGIDSLKESILKYNNTPYGEYLKNILSHTEST